MFQACLLAAAVCMDTFFAAMGCSISGIHIPKRCALLISAVGTVFLSLSLSGGQLLARLLPEVVCRYGGSVLLALLGLSQLMKEGLTSFFQRRKPHIRRKFFGLVIEICFDETQADTDHSKTLSLQETPAFAAAMSLDSLVSGLGAGLSAKSMPLCLLLTFFLGFLLTVTGTKIGQRCRNRFNGGWLGGVMLLLLAGCRFL